MPRRSSTARKRAPINPVKSDHLAFHGPVLSATPSIIVGIDPDKVRTSLAWAQVVSDSRTPGARCAYALAGLVGGGGSRTRVSWSSVTGQVAWLRELLEQTGVEPGLCRLVIETQAARSPRSRDVESLRRVRYHFDAAAEIIGCECEHVDKTAWQTFVAPVEVRGRGAGAIKDAYQVRARDLLGDRCENEDQAAAFGILRWQIEARLGGSLRLSE